MGAAENRAKSQRTAADLIARGYPHGKRMKRAAAAIVLALAAITTNTASANAVPINNGNSVKHRCARLHATDPLAWNRSAICQQLMWDAMAKHRGYKP